MPEAGHKVDYSELRRNWLLLPPCMVGIMLCSLHGYSLGVMIPALEAEYGWPRAQISGGMMIVAMIALVVLVFTVFHHYNNFNPIHAS